MKLLYCSFNTLIRHLYLILVIFSIVITLVSNSQSFSKSWCLSLMLRFSSFTRLFFFIRRRASFADGANSMPLMTTAEFLADSGF